MTITRPLGSGLAAAVLVLALAGCTASSTASSGAGASAGRAPLDAGSVPLAASAASSEKAASASDASTAARDIIRTGSLDLVAKDPLGTASRIESLVDGAAGHLDADAEQPGRNARADLTARIPASAFDATLAAIRRTGTVRSLSLRAADVTAKVTDDAVRTAALQASITRLRTLLSRASDTSDLVSLEGALTQRESDLESLQAEQRGLADQVSYASLTVSVVTPAAVPVYRPGTFAGGLADGWAALAATIAWLAVAAGVLAPWVVLFAVLAGAVLLVRRIVRRRRGDAAPTAHGAG